MSRWRGVVEVAGARVDDCVVTHQLNVAGTELHAPTRRRGQSP